MGITGAYGILGISGVDVINSSTMCSSVGRALTRDALGVSDVRSLVYWLPLWFLIEM